MSFFDIFKSWPKFNTGALTDPKKFTVTCRGCKGVVKLSIPEGFEQPSVLIECSCRKAEYIYVK